MAQTVNPTRMAGEISGSQSISSTAVIAKAGAAAPAATPTGISSITGPASITAASGAVAQQVLPINEKQAQAFRDRLTPELVAQGQAFAQEILTNPSSASLQGQWADYVSQVKAGGAGMDVGGLVQWVLRESYMQSTEDLQFYAEKVKFYNELKKQIRDELTAARTALSDVSAAANQWAKDNDKEPGEYPMTYETTEFDVAGVNFDDNGNPVVAKAKGALSPATREGLENYIKGLEEKMSSVGDDAQLANVDLQNTLQKQQQTLQMMSNISKMLNDTAMAIIRKIG